MPVYLFQDEMDSVAELLHGTEQWNQVDTHVNKNVPFRRLGSSRIRPHLSPVAKLSSESIAVF